MRERLALGAISRPTLAGLLTAIGAEDIPEARDAPAGAYAVVPLLWAGRPHGLIAVRTRRELSTEQLRLLEVLARQTMAVFTAQPEGGSPAAVQALAAAIEARDNYTHEHSEQVVSLATAVARLLGLPPAELDAVRHGALLHDVGKLAIPNEILHKPGPLTDAEWHVMAEHPVIGERILRRTPQLGHLAPIVRHEHERWDGGGYPDGLAGTEIPIASRIILACDAYKRDDHHTALPRGDVGRGRRRRAARQVRHAVRPGGRGRAAHAPARAGAYFFFGGFGVVISVAL
jgi:putative nucleotidyltransferase with HDIG domain